MINILIIITISSLFLAGILTLITAFLHYKDFTTFEIIFKIVMVLCVLAFIAGTTLKIIGGLNNG